MLLLLSSNDVLPMMYHCQRDAEMLYEKGATGIFWERTANFLRATFWDRKLEIGLQMYHMIGTTYLC
jgi:hypothetical protein